MKFKAESGIENGGRVVISESDLNKYAETYSSQKSVKLLKLETIKFLPNSPISATLDYDNIEATWESLKYPGIEAEIKIPCKNLDPKVTGLSSEKHKESMVDFLVGRGFNEVRNNERQYEQELVKIEFSQKYKDVLECTITMKSPNFHKLEPFVFLKHLLIYRK